MSPTESSNAMPLSALRRGINARICGVCVPPGSRDPALQRLALRLMEIGFIEGESVRVTAHGQPGNDPVGVRLGGRGGAGTFALRRQEAALVWVVAQESAS